VDVVRVALCGSAAWIILCSEVERYSDQLELGGPALGRGALNAGFSLGVGEFAEPQMTVAH
jgi:hypothetical protein